MSPNVITVYRVFQIAVLGGGWGKFPPVGGIRIFAGEDFLIRIFFFSQQPEEKGFWQFKPFSKLKTAFCSILWILNHQLKSKLEWPVCQKSLKLKQKWYIRQWLQLKMTFLLGYNLKCGGFFQVGEWANFLVGGDFPHPSSRKNLGFVYHWTRVSTLISVFKDVKLFWSMI